ncbi:MAG: hypothetical protein R3F59_29795 [Myxococcota bacterium]
MPMMPRAAAAALALAALAVAPAARAGCDAREISLLVGQSEVAFTEMDADGFQNASSALAASLACQQEPVTPVQAASYHRVRALAAFFDADALGTVLSFQAVLATMPGYQLPLQIAPEGHPLRQRFEEAKQFAPGDVFELVPPAHGWLTVDGTRTRNAPAARPFVFQRLDDDGSVKQTAYVGTGSPVPSYPTAVPTMSTAAPVPVLPPPPKRRVSAPLVATGAVLGAAAAGMYGASFLFRGQYDEAVAAGDEARIRSTYWTTNGLAGGSIGALGIGATCVLVGAF